MWCPLDHSSGWHIDQEREGGPKRTSVEPGLGRETRSRRRQITAMEFLITSPSPCSLSPSKPPLLNPGHEFPSPQIRPKLFTLARALRLQVFVRAERQPPAQQHQSVECETHAAVSARGRCSGGIGFGCCGGGRVVMGFGVAGLWG